MLSTNEPASLDALNDLALAKLASRKAAQYGAIRPLAPKVRFTAYVKAIKDLTLDLWQVDLCDRMEKRFWLANASKFDFVTVDIGTGPGYVIAPSGFRIDLEEFEQQKDKGYKVAIHAFPQIGKSILISQSYPCWILGYDPEHRIRLATYNVTHSKRFSAAIRRTLLSPAHMRLFSDVRGHINPRSRIDEWYTNGRLERNDSQPSFIALGLETGFTGSGADTLIMDDPYASAKEAMSQNTRDAAWSFWADTAKGRCHDATNVFLMFHRYHQDDQAGRAIYLDNFDLWRYAAQEDGDYEEPESGRVFPSPIIRMEGQYLSARRTPAWYEEQKRNQDVWLSQFQGRPAPKAGAMFNITMLNFCLPSEVPQLLFLCRAWDNAATEGGGAYSVGSLYGIDSAGNVYILDIVREQVNTAQREALQIKTAKTDGKLIAVHAPQDPGSGGKDVAFWFREEFKGWEVQTDPVSKNKEQRAYNYSIDVNKGKVYLVLNNDGSSPDWHRPFINEHQHFPFSTYKDQVDAGADAHKYITDKFKHGRVIKGVTDDNILSWDRFASRFGGKIPADWEVTIGCRISTDKTLPSGYAIMARAAENAKLGEVVFVVASAKMFIDDATILFQSLTFDLNRTCANGVKHPSTIYTTKGNDEAIALAWEKHTLALVEFPEDEEAGILETGWYFQKTKQENPFFMFDQEKRLFHAASHCYLLVDDGQVNEAENEAGQLSLRQDLMYWSRNSEGKPQPHGGIVLNCVRMNLWNFSLTATALTPEERIKARLPEKLQDDQLLAAVGTPEFTELYWAQKHAMKEIKKQERIEPSGGNQWVSSKPVTHSKYRKPRK